jgi:hypothetical protein
MLKTKEIVKENEIAKSLKSKNIQIPEDEYQNTYIFKIC